MKKRFIFPAALMIASVLALSGCGKDKDSGASAEAAKPVKEIVQDVMESGVEFPEMVSVTEDNFQLKYGLTADDYEEFSVSWAGSGADSDEVCVIKAKDVDKVKNAVNGRLDGQKEVFKDYVPEQYDKLSKSEVKTKGNYVYWVCTNDNSKAEKAIESDFK